MARYAHLLQHTAQVKNGRRAGKDEEGKLMTEVHPKMEAFLARPFHDPCLIFPLLLHTG